MLLWGMLGRSDFPLPVKHHLSSDRNCGDMTSHWLTLFSARTASEFNFVEKIRNSTHYSHPRLRSLTEYSHDWTTDQGSTLWAWAELASDAAPVEKSQRTFEELSF
jgi:hypothetical protein